jgi:hypothetical protein
MSLGGNTPFETQNGLSILLSRYTADFDEQKQLRLLKNKNTVCSNVCKHIIRFESALKLVLF